MIVVRLVDRHGDHYLGSHGDRMPHPIASGRSVRAALNDAAEWFADWGGGGDGYPFRQQWKRRKIVRTRSEGERRRDARERHRFIHALSKLSEEGVLVLPRNASIHSIEPDRLSQLI